MLDKDSILGLQYENLMDKSKRKDYGTFYTPDFIIDYIMVNTLEKVNVVKNPFLKVLDPSCGSGYFLIKAYAVLLKKFLSSIEKIKDKYLNYIYIDGGIKVTGGEYWVKENMPYHILKNCIYGSDIDNNAVELTKLNLIKAAKRNLNINDNIVCCNSLIKWENMNGNKKLHNFWNSSYDFVVGNPPWVSMKRKYGRNIDKSLMEYYIKEYNGNLYLPNLYEYFIKRSLQVLKDSGKMAFVIPNTFARNLQYMFFRREILTEYNITNLAFEMKFPNIITDIMIMILSKSHDNNNRVCLDIYNKRKYYVYQSVYLNNKNCEFSYEANNLNNIIKASMEDNSISLGDISLTFTGFIGQKTKITKEKTSNTQVKILKGQNISSFKILGTNYYEFNKDTIKGGTKDIKKLKCKNKIIVRKTGNSIIAALDTDGIIIEQSLYGVINLNEKFSYKYILGILNSKLIQWYYLNFLITNEKSVPQIKKYHLDSIPIRYCSERYQSLVGKIVDMLICSDQSKTKLQNDLDNIIFKIYGIDEVYIDIINSSFEFGSKSKRKIRTL